MANYCSNCGSELKDGINFCENCGVAVNAYEMNAQNFVYSGVPNIPVGFSDRVNDPEILEAVKKNKKVTGIFALILIPLPLIGFTIYSLISDNLALKQGIVYGAVISAIFLISSVFSAFKRRSTNSYEAVVTGKKTRERSDHNQEHAHYYVEYITYAQTTDGKKKKIVEREGGMRYAYDYLREGDRFKYHPQFNFPYELYDKSNAPYIPCVSCATKNPVEADRCSKCNIPLLK